MKKKPLLALLVISALLVACAGNGDETPVPTGGGQVTITFACDSHERSLFQDLAEGFEEVNPDIHVQLAEADEDESEFEDLAAAADSFIRGARFGPGDWMYLLDLGPFIDDPSFPAEDFLPGTLDHFHWQGRVYGLPARIDPILIFYDRGMFDEAGLPYPHAGWTWDDLVVAAARLTERDGEEVTRYGFVDPWFYDTVLAMLQQHGVSLWDDRSDPPRPLFTTPEVAAIVQRYTDLALTDKVMLLPEVESNLVASALVSAGKAAMWTDFSSSRPYHVQRTDIGVAPFPEEEYAGNPSGMFGFFISAGTVYPEAAWRWLSYLSAHYRPPVTDTLPGRRSVVEQLAWWRQLDQQTRAAYEYALAHPLTNDSPLTMPPLVWALVEVFQDEINVDQALADAQSVALKLQARLVETTVPTSGPVATPVSEAGPTVITFAPAPGEEQSLYRHLAASFHRGHADISVEVASVSFVTPEELSASRDCFGWSGSLAAVPGERQNILALGPFLEADTSFDLGDYYPQFLEPLQQEGALWGLPYEVDALLVYTNFNRFTEAGVAPPQPGWSIGDFLDIAVALSRNGRYGFTTREGDYGDLVFVLERLGGRLYDDSQGPPLPTFDDPAVVAALGQYARLYRGGALTPATPARESGWPDGTVVGGHPAGVPTGEVAMWVDSIGFHAVAPPLPFQMGVLPLPVGTAASTEFAVRAYYISAHSTAPQACWDWLTFLSEQPEIVQMLPTRRSMAASPAWQEQVGEAALPAYLATLEYTDAPLFRQRLEIPWSVYAYPWLEEAFQSTVAGQDAAAALAEAQRKSAALLECLKTAGDANDRAAVLACARQVDPNYPPVNQSP